MFALSTQLAVCAADDSMCVYTLVKKQAHPELTPSSGLNLIGPVGILCVVKIVHYKSPRPTLASQHEWPTFTAGNMTASAVYQGKRTAASLLGSCRVFCFEFLILPDSHIHVFTFPLQLNVFMAKLSSSFRKLTSCSAGTHSSLSSCLSVM